jgi:mRNA capping enzyme, beta chain
MDLRSIINTDASGAAKPQPPPSQHTPARHPSEPLGTPRPEVLTPGPSYQSGYFARPPQPSIQPPHHSPSASSAHISTQSPYQYNSTASLAGGPHSSHAQSSPPPTYQLAPRDSTPASPAVFAQPSLASPYTPQSASSTQQQQSYFNHYPGPQSAQHVPGPHSAHGYSPQPYASESPRPVNAQHPFQPQQQISPPAQRSQPGTPLGPPAGPYQRPSQSARPPSAGESMSAQASNLWNSHEPHGSEQRVGSLQHYQAVLPPHRDSRQGERLNSNHFLPESDRERSVSISPKTIVSRQSLSQDREGITPHRSSIDDDRWRHSPSGSHSHSSSVADHTKLPSHTPQPAYAHAPQAMQMSSSPLARQTPSRETPTAPLQPIKTENSEVSEVSGRPLKRKKVRYDEPPIYARRVPRGTAKGPIIPNPRPPIAKNSPTRLPLHRRSTSVQAAAPSPSVTSLQTPARPPATVNGNTPPNGRSLPPAPAEPVYGLLGPWEPSISGKIPYEEITKVVCDFLFKEVVLRRDLAAGVAGVSATGSGAILEIEAKLGKIVDKERGGRLRLPVMTECVLNTGEYRTAFESSMSLVSINLNS